LLSATAVSGLPISLVATDGTIWVSTVNSLVQALDGRSGHQRGEIDTPSRAAIWPSISTTPGVLWILVRPDAGGSRLVHLPMRATIGHLSVPEAGHVYGSRLLPRDRFSFPRMTRLVGATASALWLVSRTAAGSTLWRRDIRTASVRRFSLPSVGSPGLATGGDRVYVLLQKRSPRRVVVQTRDTDGEVVATSRAIAMQGTFEPTPLAACGGRVFGWTRNGQGAALFELHASGGVARYSRRLPPGTHPSKLTGIALESHCQNVWVSTVSRAEGVISRLRSTTLAVTGQIDTSYIRALLWTGGTLWAADLEHQAVLRLR
jgi:hypothetical protein